MKLTQAHKAAAFEWLRYLAERHGEIDDRDREQADIALRVWNEAEERAQRAGGRSGYAVPYIPDEVRRLPEYLDGMSQQLPQSPGSAQAWAQASHMIQAAIAAAPADGYKLVPVEPTEAMVDAGMGSRRRKRMQTKRDAALDTYRAMIAAAQTNSNE